MGCFRKTLDCDNFLSKRTTDHIKGILACMVIMSHLSGRVQLFSHSIFGTIFSACGYLAVSVFFFLSGFGLHAQYSKSPKAYIKNFPGRKILPYYAMCCAVVMLYFIRDVATGSVDWASLAQSFLVGGTIVDNGWYLQTQLVLYVIFFLSFRLLQDKGLWLACAATALYCVACAVAGLSEFWYESALCFVLGIGCSKYKNHILYALQNKTRSVVMWIGLAAVFLVALFFGNKAILPSAARILVKMVSAFCFTGIVVLTVAFIKTENSVTVFLGKYSFELYVLQGFFLHGYRPVIQNDWLYMLAAAGSTFVAALVAKPGFSALSKLVAVPKESKKTKI